MKTRKRRLVKRVRRRQDSWRRLYAGLILATLVNKMTDFNEVSNRGHTKEKYTWMCWQADILAKLLVRTMQEK